MSFSGRGRGERRRGAGMHGNVYGFGDRTEDEPGSSWECGRGGCGSDVQPAVLSAGGLEADMGNFRGSGQPVGYSPSSGFGEPRGPLRAEPTSWRGLFRNSRTSPSTRERERESRPGGAFSRPARRYRQEQTSYTSSSYNSPPSNDNNDGNCIINGVRVTREMVDFIVKDFDDGMGCDAICDHAARRFGGDRRSDGDYFDPEIIVAALTMTGRFIAFEDDGFMHRWMVDEETDDARGVGEGVMMYQREADRDGLPVMMMEMEGRSGMLPGFFDRCFRRP